ncbi:DUF2332 family protein [Mesorhizobium sp. DCY119]|uniref:DUF2332 domain-containing protein n=1 Tax=Mesorhizobium sp. DCY119 TaxID=2108445 RepID=UPI000E6C34C6|nr:DUF2332 family protein [Mesorhizobium sp. DCY119]RJG43415.1 DUF2332 family protein [Mesorhizobium sp. DCY119]
MKEAAIREHFVHQAAACDALGSPFTARLCRALAASLDRGTKTGARVLDWPGHTREDALALRLCGGLHALVLSGADGRLAAIYPPNDVDEAAIAAALPEAIFRNDDRLLAALASAPQTNEIARSGLLLPGFLTIASETGLPLALHEIGSSAALNLLFDRFHYRYGDVEWGDPASPVRLAPDMRGKPVPLDGALKVVSRNGSDIAPVDIGIDADRLRLRSYIWADQTARLERIDAAISVAGTTPFSLEKADAADFVKARLAARRSEETFVLFHSIMWQYMPDATKAAIVAELAAAGNAATPHAPIAWLRMEPVSTADKYATLSLTLWPGGETRHLAHCDYHGRWIAWN